MNVLHPILKIGDEFCFFKPLFIKHAKQLKPAKTSKTTCNKPDTHNRLKPAKTTHNQPKQPTTSQNYQNPAKTSQSYIKAPTASQNYTKTAKPTHKYLQFLIKIFHN